MRIRPKARSKPGGLRDREVPRLDYSNTLALSGLAVLMLGFAGAWIGGEREEAPLDLVIARARIVDGSGGAWYRGDIGVREGRIVGIGRLSGVPAKRVIDARNRVAAPGFIDVHTHVEGNLPARPDAENLTADGVTSLVTGNCGASELEVGSWFARLEQTGTAVNVATLVGHSGIRSKVMGNANRAPTARELAEMEALVRRAMREGAMGLSSGLIYTPGAFAKPAELASLARVAGELGGLYATHMRSENDRVFESIEESLAVAREANLPLQISHFKVTSKRLRGASARMLERVERARSEGMDVTLDQYPYTASSSGLEVLLPEWALEASRGSARRALLKRLSRPALRRRIAREMYIRLHDELGHDDLEYAVVAGSPWDPSLEGKSLRELHAAVSAGGPGDLRAEIETLLDVCERGGKSDRAGGPCGTQMIYHTMEEEDVERIFASPLTMVARDGGVALLGAGLPHPRSFGTAARVLARYVRERKIVRLEEAIRKMTSLPAQRFGFQDRGLLREGFCADLVLFDPDRVADLSTFGDPHHESTGIDVVLVNGRLVREEGRPTCERPGRVLRGPATEVPHSGRPTRNSSGAPLGPPNPSPGGGAFSPSSPRSSAGKWLPLSSGALRASRH